MLSAFGNSITLDSPGNNFSTVLIAGAVNATLADSNALDLSTVSLSGGSARRSSGSSQTPDRARRTRRPRST